MNTRDNTLDVLTQFLRNAVMEMRATTVADQEVTNAAERRDNAIASVDQVADELDTLIARGPASARRRGIDTAPRVADPL